MRGWCSVSISDRARGACAMLVVASAAMAGCTSTIPVPSTSDGQWAQTRWPDANVASLTRGRELYVNKCAGCHSLYVPSTIPASHWPSMIEEMRERANLQPTERDLILHYLVTASRGVAEPHSSGGSGS